MASVNGDDYGLFWNSEGGDREYNGDSFEHWLKKFFVSGVFNGDLQVTATSGMGISVGSGYINVEGKVRLFNADTPFTLESASASNPRIDTVVVERNETDRAITLKVVTGTPSANPQPTAPVRTDGVYQLVLAQIYIDTAASSISQSNITDTRTDSALCGYVASTVTEIDFDQIMAQYRAWFDEFVSHLDGDVAIELQLEIDNLNTTLEEISERLQTLKLNDLQDVSISDLENGHSIVYDASIYKWINAAWNTIPTNLLIANRTTTKLSDSFNYGAAVTFGDYAVFAGGSGTTSNNGYSGAVNAFNQLLTRSVLTSLTNKYCWYNAGASIDEYVVFAGGQGSSTSYMNGGVDAYNTSLVHSTPTSLGQNYSQLQGTSNDDYVLFGGGTTATTGTYGNKVYAYNNALTRSTCTTLSASTYYTSAYKYHINNFNGKAAFVNVAGVNDTPKKIEAYDNSLTKSIPCSYDSQVTHAAEIKDNKLIMLNYLSGGGYKLYVFDSSFTKINEIGVDSSIEKLNYTNNFILTFKKTYDKGYAYDDNLTRTPISAVYLSAASNTPYSHVGEYAIFGDPSGGTNTVAYYETT